MNYGEYLLSSDFGEAVADGAEDAAIILGLSKQKVTTPGKGFEKASTVVKKLPYVALGLNITDGVDGYVNPKDKRLDTTTEKLASAAGAMASGFSFGFVPEKEASLGLSRLLTGNVYDVDLKAPTKKELAAAKLLQKKKEK